MTQAPKPDDLPRDDLPGEVLRPATPRSIALTLCLTALVLLGINAAANAVLERRGPNRGYRLLSEKWRLLGSIEAPLDWLVLGDSSCNQGVSPAVLARSLGGRALNLCTMGGAIALNDAWMLQRYLERHPPPKGVIIVHVYDVWGREIRPTVLGKIPAATPLALGELKPRPALPARDWAGYALARWAPLYAENQSLAHMVENPSRAFVLPPLNFEDGFEPRDGANPPAVQSDLRRHMAELVKRGRFTMSATNRASLARIRELAEDRGVPVYIASAPLFSWLTQAPAFQAFQAEIMAALDEAAGTSGRVRVVLRDPPPMPIELLQNVDHVTREGAIVYSEELARAVLAERANE
jgi:hypothetical protein